MAIVAKQLIEEVNRYLLDDGLGYDDYEFEHWAEQELLDYFRMAVEIVASTQKHKFVKRTVISLRPGRVQDVPDSCRDDVKVVGQRDSSGRITTFPRRTHANALHLYGRIGCKDCDAKQVSASDYRVNSWQYDETDPNTLYVDPPVPDGATGELEISCFIPPSVDDVDSAVDIAATLRPAVFELMLYYAYGRDTESVPYRDRSATHWNNAFSLLGIDGASQRNRYALTRNPELRLGAKK